MIKNKLLILGALLVVSLLFFAPTAYAKTAADCKSQDFFGIPTWYEYLSFDDSCNPTTDAANSVVLILFAAMDILLYIGGFIAAFYIIYGGYQFILAQGSPDKISSARQTILNAVIGLVILLVASQIAGFVAKRIAGL